MRERVLSTTGVTSEKQNDMAIYIGDKNITEVAAGNALESAKQYADQGDASTLTQAQTYTNEREESIRTDYTEADATTLQSAQAYADNNKVDKTDIGVAGGVAELDDNGLILSSQLPSYVDDVLEYDSLGSFPASGEAGKIYVAKDSNLTYRWSGSGYVEISPSLALGETSSTAYRGDLGKTAYDHSQIKSGNPHGTTFASLPDKPTSLPANGGNAESAVKDGNGNIITDNYFKLLPDKVSDLNDVPINSFFVSALGPSYSPVSYASYVNGFCVAADNNSSDKRQLVYADDWYGRIQVGGTWRGWNKFWHSGNFSPNYKFDNLETTLDSKNEVGNGYTFTEVGASFSGPFLKWGKPDWMFEFYSPNDINNVYLRNMFDGAWQNPVKLWHSGNLNPVTIDSDQIITGWKRFNPSARNGVFNTTGIIDNKDTFATPLSWTAKADGSIWNIQQESDSITLIGIQGGKAVKLVSTPAISQVTADRFNGAASNILDRSNNSIKSIWTGTQAEYDDISTKDSNTIYFIV